MTDRVVVEADGGSRGNPGPAGYGAVVRTAVGGRVLETRHGYLGVATNNVAEYRGLIAGLEAALGLGARHVEVRMDSKLVVEQVSGRWQVKHPSMKPLARQAIDLLARFETHSRTWIPRAENGDADRLANLAMDEGTGTGSAPSPAPSPAARTRMAPASWQSGDPGTTRLLLARHGSTDHSPQHRMSGRNAMPLNTSGQAQVAALAARLADELGGTAGVAIVCSPVLRTRQTADAIATATGLPVTVDDDLAELDFGQWEGLTPADIRAGWAAEFDDWIALGTPDVRPPGGESVAELSRRVAAARDRILAAHPGGTVVVVSHVTPIKSLVVDAIGAPASSMMRMFLTPASLSELRFHADGGATLRTFNGRGHLAHLPDY